MIYRLVTVVLACALLGCRPGQQSGTPAPQAPKFLTENSVLYREDASGRKALLALDSTNAPSGAVIAPSTWTPSPGSTFGVAAKQFRLFAAAPDAQWVAWETAGAVHDLLGLVPGQGGKLTVLDFYFDSSASELSWAPGSRYLAALYTPPSGMAEVRVYDARTGSRIKTPWQGEVSAMRWIGPVTISVKTSAREYQTDVSKL